MPRRRRATARGARSSERGRTVPGMSIALDLLIDAASRPREALDTLRQGIAAAPRALDAHPGGHDNSVAWLLWHTGREIDVQVADLSGQPERWDGGGFAERTGLGEAGAGIGYGHTPEQARAITVREAEPLLEYLDAAVGSLLEYLGTLTETDLTAVIDEAWDPPVTRGARLVSIIDDAAKHLGQAAYVLGMPELR